jgi:hypothetical protein
MKSVDLRGLSSALIANIRHDRECQTAAKRSSLLHNLNLNNFIKWVVSQNKPY